MYSDKIEKLLKGQKIKVGDTIKISSKKGDFEGTLMPRTESGDSGIFIVKLGNGYNIGIKADSSLKISLIKSGNREFSFPKMVAKHGRNPESVSLIYTGGTIGSKIDYVTGGVHMLTKPEELLYEVPELSGIANIDVKNLMQIASEDMTHLEWAEIANAAVKSLNEGARGIVITHGTDTMHFTSAALSFMLKDLNAPVVLTGAQRSSDRGSSDAFMNLICSTYIAARSDIAEVGICMHATPSDNACSFIRGTKARKMHTSRRDAFKPINSMPIALVSQNGKISYESDYKKRQNWNKNASALTKFDPKVALANAYPNSDPGIIDYYIKKGFKGIIIEGTGLGHAPVSPSITENSWLKNIKDAIDSGVIIGMTSQCIYGRVNMNVYRNLRLLSETGVIYCEDMLPEVAFVKLGFLLGNYGQKKAKEMLGKNMAGEMTERIEMDVD